MLTHGGRRCPSKSLEVVQAGERRREGITVVLDSGLNLTALCRAAPIPIQSLALRDTLPPVLLR
jgi:hypothetical protein